MKLHRCELALVGILLASIVGCAGQKDITQTLEVQRSGVIGQCFEVSAQSDLIKDRRSLLIVAPDDWRWRDDPRIGKVDAGTRVIACRVIEVTELAEVFIVLPSYWKHDDTMSRILNGPFAGKEVNLTRSRWGDGARVFVPTTIPSSKP